MWSDWPRPQHWKHADVSGGGLGPVMHQVGTPPVSLLVCGPPSLSHSQILLCPFWSCSLAFFMKLQSCHLVHCSSVSLSSCLMVCCALQVSWSVGRSFVFLRSVLWRTFHFVWELLFFLYLALVSSLSIIASLFPSLLYIWTQPFKDPNSFFFFFCLYWPLTALTYIFLPLAVYVSSSGGISI